MEIQVTFSVKRNDVDHESWFVRLESEPDSGQVHVDVGYPNIQRSFIDGLTPAEARSLAKVLELVASAVEYEELD